MFDTSADAEEAFYAAFSIGRLEDMMRVWAPNDDIVCIHPGGPRLAGVQEIRRSWALIFQNSMLRTFTVRGRMVTGDGTQRVHLLEENIRIPGTAFIAPPVLATNVYRRLAQGWRMVVHHASVAPTRLGLSEPGPERPGQPKPRIH